MCHSNFEWAPNKSINFLTGQNGSGKSSILQGLVLGLLAESKATKRYTKLQDFIKKGCSKAEIQVNSCKESYGHFNEKFRLNSETKERMPSSQRFMEGPSVSAGPFMTLDRQQCRSEMAKETES